MRGLGAILLILKFVQCQLVHLQLARLKLDEPLDTNNKDQLSLSRDIVGAFLLAQPREPDLLALCIAVLLDVGLGTLEDDATLLLVGLE